MTASIQSPADLVNYGLRLVGYKKRIGSLYDGSEAAIVALDVYAQVRDEMLRGDDTLDFAEGNATLQLLKQAPANGYINTPWQPINPALPWWYEYAYPADCLKVRSIRPQPNFVMDFDPAPNVFQTANDNYYVPAQKVILTDVPNALIVYTRQVTDLTTWEADAIEAFAARLGARLAPKLLGLNSVKLAASEAQQATAEADAEQG